MIALSIKTVGGKKIVRGLRMMRRPGADPLYADALKLSGVKVLTSIRALVSGRKLRVRTGRYVRSFRTASQRPAHYRDIGTKEERVGPHEFGWPAKNFPKRSHVEPGVRLSIRDFPPIWTEAFERHIGRPSSV